MLTMAVPLYRTQLQTLNWQRPSGTVLSSVHGDYYAHDAAPAWMARHLALRYILPLEFMKHVQRLHLDGVRYFLEAGPKWSLTAFTQSILKTQPFLAQASVHPKVGEVEQFHRFLAFCDVHQLMAAS